MAQDLRTFMAYLERNHPRELVRVSKPVDPHRHIAGILRRFQAEREDRGYPAIWFENVEAEIPMPVVTNLLGTRSRLGAMLGTTAKEALNEYMKREETLIPPRQVPTGPIKDHILHGDDIDVRRFPIPWHAEKDGGPYITGAVLVMRNPDTGVLNAGIYRLQPKGPRKFGVSIGTHSHAYRIMKLNEAKGRDTEIAFFLGHHPAIIAGSQSRVPDYVSEYDVFGGMLGEPLQVCPAETVDLLIPTHAEIVFEGRLIGNLREMEGPLGEYTWYYGPQRLNPVLEIDCVSYRNNPIYYDLNNCWHEHVLSAVLSIEGQVFRQARRVIPGLKRVRMPESGACSFVVFGQIEKMIQGQGANAALALLAAETWLKMAVVVDEDIDIDDDTEVWWAVTTRSQASKNWFFVPNAHCQRLLPISHDETTGHAPGQQSHLEGLDTKIGIDATKPLSYPFSEREDVRRSEWEALNLDDWIETRQPVGSIGDD